MTGRMKQVQTALNIYNETLTGDTSFVYMSSMQEACVTQCITLTARIEKQNKKKTRKGAIKVKGRGQKVPTQTNKRLAVVTLGL